MDGCFPFRHPEAQEGPKFDARAVQECGNDPTALLRVSTGGGRDFILPASCLDELLGTWRLEVPQSARERVHAGLRIPGSRSCYLTSRHCLSTKVTAERFS